MVKENLGKGNLLRASRKHRPTLDKEPREKITKAGGKLGPFYGFA